MQKEHWNSLMDGKDIRLKILTNPILIKRSFSVLSNGVPVLFT
jgi:hypothetical protein